MSIIKPQETFSPSNPSSRAHLFLSLFTLFQSVRKCVFSSIDRRTDGWRVRRLVSLSIRVYVLLYFLCSWMEGKKDIVTLTHKFESVYGGTYTKRGNVFAEITCRERKLLHNLHKLVIMSRRIKDCCKILKVFISLHF